MAAAVAKWAVLMVRHSPQCLIMHYTLGLIFFLSLFTHFDQLFRKADCLLSSEQCKSNHRHNGHLIGMEQLHKASLIQVNQHDHSAKLLTWAAKSESVLHNEVVTSDQWYFAFLFLFPLQLPTSLGNKDLHDVVCLFCLYRTNIIQVRQCEL